MKNLTISEVEQITKCNDIEMYGITTETPFTYEFYLDFNDSNFGKKKGWLKDGGAKWNADKKCWVIASTKRLQRTFVDMITRIDLF